MLSRPEPRTSSSISTRELNRRAVAARFRDRRGDETVVAQIQSPCPLPNCSGKVLFTPVATREGAFGECDQCGAMFRLKEGLTEMVRPPNRDH
jgi:hypothetical protein